MPFTRESSRPRDQARLAYVSRFGRQVLYPPAPPAKPPIILLIDIHTYHTTTENSCVIFLKFYFIFKLYITVLVLPNMLLALRKLFSLKYRIFN